MKVKIKEKNVKHNTDILFLDINLLKKGDYYENY